MRNSDSSQKVTPRGVCFDKSLKQSAKSAKNNRPGWDSNPRLVTESERSSPLGHESSFNSIYSRITELLSRSNSFEFGILAKSYPRIRPVTTLLGFSSAVWR